MPACQTKEMIIVCPLFSSSSSYSTSKEVFEGQAKKERRRRTLKVGCNGARRGAIVLSRHTFLFTRSKKEVISDRKREREAPIEKKRRRVI